MTTPRKLMCFCYSGGQRAKDDKGMLGTYVGGVCEPGSLEEGISYDALLEEVCNRLVIQREGISLFYSTSADKSKHLRVRDDRGVALMFQLNEGQVDIYVEQESACPPPLYNPSSRESNLFGSSPPSVAGDIGTSSDACHEMGLISYLKERGSEILTGPGQLFANGDEFKKAVLLFATINKFTYKYKDNSKKYYRLVCTVDGCPWKLTASLQGPVGQSELVRVCTLINEHCHTADDDASYKARIRAKEMGMIFKDKLSCQPNMVPRTICKDFELAFHMELTYKQGWRTRERARELISGPVKKTYHLVPWMCERLEQSIPNTRAIWTCSDDGKFKQLFVAYGCSITGFLAGCRPMLFVDACFLTGPYKGSCLSAVAYDANDQLWPVAYAIVSSENYEDWLWFMGNLKVILQGKPVVIMTDRNPGLLRAVSELFGEECNAWCLRHLKENFSKFANSKGFRANRKKTAMDLITSVGYARTQRMYGVHMTSLHGLSPDLAKWVDENGPTHWANSLFPFRRWDKLYTNIAESFNNWIVKERELDIIGFMKGHIHKTSDMLLRRKLEIEKWTLPVGPAIDAKMKVVQEKSRGFTSRPIAPAEFIVCDATFKSYSVKLHSGECSCSGWYQKGIPCKHAVRAIEGTQYNIYELVDPAFRVGMQKKIYENIMSPVPMHDMPSPTDVESNVDAVQFSGNLFDMPSSSSSGTPVLLPPATKRPPGRPKKKRIESQFQDKVTVVCSRCHEAGHNRTTCKSPLID